MSRIVCCLLAGLVLAAVVEREAQAGRLAAVRRARAAAANDALAVAAAALERRSVMAPGAACCPPPAIVYRHLGPRPCSSCAAVPTVLTVVNPCTCCPVEIPLCLPACCTGTPLVGSRPGILARGVVTYDWCCGVNVTIRFKPCGEIVVVTHGV